MKLFLSFVLLLSFLFNSSAPAIFKESKTISGRQLFGRFSTGKYKKVRIAVHRDEVTPDKKTYISVYGYEGDTFITLDTYNEETVNYTTVIDVPPDEMAIVIAGNGKYDVTAWGVE